MIRVYQTSLIAKSLSKKTRGTISESIEDYKKSLHIKSIEFYNKNKDILIFEGMDDAELQQIFID